MFQPTLPHGERLLLLLYHLTNMVVSTHAPAWGATNMHSQQMQQSFCFNPRSRMGSDEEMSPDGAEAGVSTHAPAWGATFLVSLILIMLLRFQPTLPHGERPSFHIRYARLSVFQPTLPHGERRCPKTSCVTCWQFQPTLPHGERPTLN